MLAPAGMAGYRTARHETWPYLFLLPHSLTYIPTSGKMLLRGPDGVRGSICVCRSYLWFQWGRPSQDGLVIEISISVLLRKVGVEITEVTRVAVRTGDTPIQFPNWPPG
jgi:hypothetical protein